MLLGGTFGQRLEPVGDMGHSVGHRPFLHPAGHSVGGVAVEGHSVVYAFEQRLERRRIEVLVHLGPVEHKFSVVVGSLPGGILDFHRLLLE